MATGPFSERRVNGFSWLVPTGINGPGWGPSRDPSRSICPSCFCLVLQEWLRQGFHPVFCSDVSQSGPGLVRGPPGSPEPRVSMPSSKEKAQTMCFSFHPLNHPPPPPTPRHAMTCPH